MKRETPHVALALGFVGLAAIGCLGGCTAKTACGRDAQGERFTSDEHSGSLVLSEAKERAESNFALALRGLPELWPNESAIVYASLALTLTIRYVDDPDEAGATQMPRLRIGIAGDGTTETDTPSVPPPEFSHSYPIFGHCFSDDPACCPFGSRECERRLTLSFERTDGAPFPPVTVGWKLSAQASIDDCPLGKSNPELTLERIDP